MPQQLPVVAVIDATAEGVVVWWVNVAVGHDLRMSRLCGAWVLDPNDTETLERVVTGRIALVTTAGAKVLQNVGLNVQPQLDLAETWNGVLAARAGLQEVFVAAQAERPNAKRLTPPSWPTFPDLLDLDDPPQTTLPAPPYRALAIARWLEQLCRRWGDLEGQRLARPPLRSLGGPDPRPMPLSFAVAP